MAGTIERFQARQFRAKCVGPDPRCRAAGRWQFAGELVQVGAVVDRYQIGGHIDRVVECGVGDSSQCVDRGAQLYSPMAQAAHAKVEHFR